MRRLTALLVALSSMWFASHGQAPLPSPSVPQPANRSQNQPPLPPAPASPIELFRELLKLSPAEREQKLAHKTERHRTYLLNKLREYESLAPDERERRLKTVQLRWYLRPLMELPAERRVTQLNAIPADDRPLIEERLRQWDQLPVEVQKQVLTSEWMLQYVVQLEASTPAGKEIILSNITDTRRRELEEQLAGWKALPAEQRQRMVDQFRQFFELPPIEKEKTLRALSDAERQQLEQTLKQFEQLPSAQRQSCIDSFRKFVNMSSEERALFLRNAELWKQMSSQEREVWRTLVRRLPPLPPGMSPGPPVPGGFAGPKPQPSISNAAARSPLPPQP
ncbi:MAG: DUF3106 domain-containing protein [Verrucomicrobiota bacterium]